MAQQRDCEKEGGVNWQRLKELAERAVSHDDRPTSIHARYAARMTLCDALDPQTVLAMVAEHAAVREARDALRDKLADAEHDLEMLARPREPSDAANKSATDKLLELTAQIAAHRGCCGTEHDPANGKLHGYCVVCGVPWPCEYAGKPPRAEP